MIGGSCLCGQVKYAVKDQITKIIHCHCPTCRKAHAAAFSSVARVNKQGFVLKSGDELLKAYESSPGKKRYFCSTCGSQIYAYKEGQDYMVLRLGTLDDDPGAEQSCHIFMSVKAPWFELDSTTPQFEKWPE